MLPEGRSKTKQKHKKNTTFSYTCLFFYALQRSYSTFVLALQFGSGNCFWNECPYCHHLTKFQLTVQDSSKIREQDYFQMQLTLKMYSKSTPVMLKSRVHKTNLLQSKILKTQILKNSVYFTPPVQAERSPVWAALLLR